MANPNFFQHQFCYRYARSANLSPLINTWNKLLGKFHPTDSLEVRANWHANSIHDRSTLIKQTLKAVE